jgi:hypothetical protein
MGNAIGSIDWKINELDDEIIEHLNGMCVEYGFSIKMTKGVETNYYIVTLSEIKVIVYGKERANNKITAFLKDAQTYFMSKNIDVSTWQDFTT